MFYNGVLLMTAGTVAMDPECCCEATCCDKLPLTLYAHVTFNCADGAHTDVINLLESQYTGACLTTANGIRIWEGTGTVNNGRGSLLVRFACTGTSDNAGNYYACTDGCVPSQLACTDCPPTGWTLLGTSPNCASGTLGTYTVSPSPGGCGNCPFPPAPSMEIVFKTTP